MKRILFILALLLGFNSLAKAEFGLMYVKAELDLKDRGKGIYYFVLPAGLVALERCPESDRSYKNSSCALEQVNLAALRKKYSELATQSIQLYQKLHILYAGVIANDVFIGVEVADIKAIRPIELLLSSSLDFVALLPTSVYDSILHVKPSLCLAVDLYDGEAGKFSYFAYVYNKALSVKDVYKICAQHARALQHSYYEYNIDALKSGVSRHGKVDITPKLEAEMKRNVEVRATLRTQGIYIIRQLNPC